MSRKVVVEKSKTVRVSGRDLPLPPCKMVGVKGNWDKKYHVEDGAVVRNGK